MQNIRRASRVLGPALILMISIGVAAAALASSCGASFRIQKAGAVYVVASGTRSYTFDAAWRVEKAWTRDRPADPWKPAATSAPWVDAFRSALLRDRNLRNLDAIPREAEDEQKVLRALGYI